MNKSTRQKTLQHLLILSATLVAECSLGFDSNFQRSQGSTITTNKISLKQKIDASRLSVSASSSKDSSSSTTDDTSNYLKIGYKYKFQDKDSIGVDIKKSDDFYNYASFGGAVKYTTIFKKLPNTKINFKFDSYKRTYDKDKSEFFTQNSVMAGFDQDFFEHFTLGADYTKYVYNQQGAQTKLAFKDQNSTSDIINTVSGLSDNTISSYIETNFSDFTLGVSYTVDSPLLPSSNRSNTSEIYGEWQMFEQFGVNISYTHGRTENSTTNSDTTSFGLNYSF